MPAQPPEHPGCRPARGRRPLPDPAAVRLCLIPDAAPPYDAEPVAGTPAVTGAGPPAAGRPRPAVRQALASPGGPPGPGTGPTPGRKPAAGPVPGWPSQFAQVLAETLAGSRHPRQIVPWTTERARESIQRLGPRLASRQQPRVRRVVTFRPTADVLEMTIVVGFGARVRAVAVRLERAADDGAARPGAARSRPPVRPWLCTAVEAA